MDLLHYRKTLLEDFWKKFGPRLNQGVGYKLEDKLEALKILAGTVVFYRRKVTRERFRRKFVRGSQKRFKKLFGNPCFVCGNEMSHRHHIIALNHGGDNSKKNLVSLCLEHHKAMHDWME